MIVIAIKIVMLDGDIMSGGDRTAKENEDGREALSEKIVYAGLFAILSSVACNIGVFVEIK